MFNPSFLREQEQKKRYKGRGKYKRKIQQYFFDFFNWKGEHMRGGIAFGYKDMKRQRSIFYHDHKHMRYRVKVTKGTKAYASSY